jgi:hypothetical protein
MTTHVIEGTLAEVEAHLRALPIQPTERFRVTLEPAAHEEAGRTRNGFRLLPTRDPHRTVTNELVNELLENE